MSDELISKNRLGGFLEGLDAVRAHFYTLAVNLGPLEVGFLSALAGRVIMTAQKDAAGDHAGTFLATWAFNGHF